MTDRTDHYLAAQGALADARELGWQAKEPTTEAAELSCLAYAAVHALLAIHDTLTAADRYAANEAKQREAEPDPLDEDDHAAEPLLCVECGEELTDHPVWDDLCFRCFRIRRRLTTAEVAWALIGQAVAAPDRYAANEARQRELELEDAWQSRDWETVRRLQDEAEQREDAPEPDPLDENDHRDRVDRYGAVVRRKGFERWAWPELPGFDEAAGWSLSSINVDRSLTFAPDAAPDAPRAAGDESRRG